MKKKILSFIILLSFLNIFGIKNIRFSHLTKKDGLSQNIVTDIQQDKMGYLWFATRNGLNRYDGFYIKNYFFEEENINSLPENSIKSLYKDLNKDLWIFTNNSVCKYILPHDNFKTYSIPERIESVTLETFYDKFKNFQINHITSNANIALYNHSLDAFENLFISDLHKTENYLIKQCYIDNNENLWIFYREKSKMYISKYDPSNKSIIKVESKELNFNEFTSIIDDNNGRLWIGSWLYGLFSVDKTTLEAKEIFFMDKSNLTQKNETISDFLIDENNNLWFTVWNGGLVFYDTKLKKYHFNTREIGIKESISTNNATKIFKDKDDNFWIGNIGGGVDYFNLNEQKVEHIRKLPDKKQSLPNNNIYALMESRDGKLWIGTDKGGLAIYDYKNKKFETPLTGKQNFKKNSTVISLLEDSENNVWIGNWFEELQRFDKKSNKITNYSPPKNFENVPRCIFEDSKNQIWLGGEVRGLSRYNKKTDSFKIIKNKKNKRLIEHPIYSIVEGKNNDLWLGTSKNTFRYNPDSEQLTEIFLKKKNEIRKNLIYHVWALKTDLERNCMWIGTNGSGLKKIDLDTNADITPKFLNVFSNSVFYSIMFDEEKNLWLSSENGIYSVNPEKQTYHRFDTSKGFQGLSFNQGAFGKLKNGKLMYGSQNGFNTFYPHKIKPDAKKPKILITKIIVDNNKPMKYTPNIEIKYQSNVKIHFIALDFTFSENIEFKYILDGFEDEWTFSNSEQRIAKYTNLSPGKYKFIVKGTNSDGVWNNEGRAINITVLKPFWMKWWFFLAIIIIFIFIVDTIFKLKTHLIRKKNLKLEKLIHKNTLELQEKNLKLNKILENAIAGIIILDESFKITYCNKYFFSLLNYDSKDVKNKNFTDFIEKGDLETYQKKVISQKGDKNNYSQLKLKCKIGYKWIGISSTKMTDKFKKNSYLHIVIDLDTQKKSEDKLIQLEKKNSALAMAITANHEINQPLAVISGYAEILQASDLPDKYMSKINLISKMVFRIKNILQKMNEIKFVKLKDYTNHDKMVDIHLDNKENELNSEIHLYDKDKKIK